MAMAGSSSQDHVVRTDFSLKPVSGIYNARPPRNWMSQIHWVRGSYQTVVTTSTTAITEQNNSFTLSTFLSAAGSYAGIFDQYYIDSVAITVANNSPQGGTGVCPQVYSALDWDSVSTLGSLALIAAFNNCNISTLAAGTSVTRYISPSNATTVATSATSGVTRTWIDSIYTAIPFYGWRLIVNNTPGAAVQLDVTFSTLFAFRNIV